MPLKFFNWNILFFGQKEPINVQIFRLLSALMEVHPILHAIFETTRSGFIQILHHCPVSRKITPCIFLVQTSYTLETKTAYQSETFELLSRWVKIHQILHVILETTCQCSFKLCITLQCHEITFLYFFSWNFIWFLQKQPIKVQNFRQILTA